jgi:hypothetical protein
MDILHLLDALDRAAGQLPENITLSPVKDDIGLCVARWKRMIPTGMELENAKYHPDRPYIPLAERIQRVRTGIDALPIQP